MEEPPPKKKKKKKKKSSSKKEPIEEPLESPPTEQQDEDDEEGDVITIVVGKKPSRGKLWKNVETGQFLKYHCDSSNIDYKVRTFDSKYLSTYACDDPI